MNLGERLKKARMRVRLTGSMASKKLNIAPSTLSNYEKNLRKPNINMLKKMSDLYNVPIGILIDGTDIELFYGDNINGGYKIYPGEKIPILGMIQAGQPIITEENILAYTDLPSEYIGRGEYFALYVVGDSMDKSRICEGDIVIVRKQDNIENGEIGVILIDSEAFTIKKVFINKNIVTLMPNSTNPIHKPQNYDLHKTSVKILGKVCEVKIKL